MIQFGTGKVDFAAVFGTLKDAGFDGPIMVECCKVGATPTKTMQMRGTSQVPRKRPGARSRERNA